MARIAHCLVAAAVALAGCRRVEEPLGQRRFAATSATAAALPPTLPEVTELFTLPGSAYQATLFVDGEATELLTETAAYRLVPGEKPVHRALDLGFAATLTSRSYVYWSKGAIRSARRHGSETEAPEVLVPLAQPPQRIVADSTGAEIAWLERSADDRYAIVKLVKGRAQRLYASSGSIDTLTLIGDSLFFIERPSRAGWRVGRAPLDAGNATFTTEKTGRWPAMLAGAREPIFYDGNRREVLALSPDLRSERALAKDFICSPLAASARVYCSNLDGIFELTDSGEPRRIVAGPRPVVASLAASSERLAFISDVGARGQDRLSVSLVALAAKR